MRISELGVPSSVTANDRVVVLTSPGTPIINVQTITLTNFGKSLAQNNFPIANTTQAGIVRVGDGVSVDSNTASLNVTISADPGSVPTTSVFPGKQGQMRIDNNYLYVCVALNIWKRVPLDAAF